METTRASTRWPSTIHVSALMWVFKAKQWQSSWRGREFCNKRLLSEFHPELSAPRKSRLVSHSCRLVFFALFLSAFIWLPSLSLVPSALFICQQLCFGVERAASPWRRLFSHDVAHFLPCWPLAMDQEATSWKQNQVFIMTTGFFVFILMYSF